MAKKKHPSKRSLKQTQPAQLSPPSDGWAWTIAAPLLSLLALFASWLALPQFNFNRWDNFEVFTPTTIYTHGLWLSGHLPLVNLHQNLGETIMGNGQSGALYLPFTVGLLILKTLGLSPQSLPSLMAFLHFPLGALGWYCFLNRYSVRKGLAVMGALSLISSGFFISGASIWQHIGSEYAWFPWLLYWLNRSLHDSDPRRAMIGFALSWFFAASGSHVQMLIYIALHLGLYVGLTLSAQGQIQSHGRRLILPTLWMITLALPSLVYTMAIRAHSVRAEALPEKVFFEAPLQIKHLLGLVTPLASVGEPYFGVTTSLFSFAGIWLCLGIVALFYHRHILRQIWPLGVISLLFLDFALGDNGLIYPLTRVLPVWSSFRWPYKFTLHFLSMLTVVSLVGLSLLGKELKTKATSIAVALVVVNLAISPPKDPWSWLMALSQVAILGSLIQTFKWRDHVLAATGTLTLLASLGLNFSNSANFYNEKYGAYGKDYFQLDQPMKYRLATIASKPCRDHLCTMQPLSNFHAATANHYLALSGHVMGMTPTAISDLISANAWGVLNAKYLREAIGSSFLRSLGTRYYLTATPQKDSFLKVFSGTGFTHRLDKDGWSLFEDTKSSQALSLPERIGPEPTRIHPQTIYAINGSDTYYVEGESRVRTMGPAELLKWDWLPGRGVRAEVNNTSAEPVLLHASVFPYRFMLAQIDGAAVDVLRSQIVGSGVMVPPGQHVIEIKASARPLLFSLILALVSLMGGVWLLRSRSFLSWTSGQPKI